MSTPNTTLARVIKMGGQAVLPTLQTTPLATPNTSRSTTPINKSLKKSIRFTLPDIPTPANIEVNTIELEPLEPLEVALYQIDTNRVDPIKSVTFNIIINDEFEHVASILKRVDLGSFTVLISNLTDHARVIQLCYAAFF